MFSPSWFLLCNEQDFHQIDIKSFNEFPNCCSHCKDFRDQIFSSKIEKPIKKFKTHFFYGMRIVICLLINISFCEVCSIEKFNSSFYIIFLRKSFFSCVLQKKNFFECLVTLTFWQCLFNNCWECRTRRHSLRVEMSFYNLSAFQFYTQ